MTRYYTYKVTFKDLPGYFYYGRKKDDGKEYYGSPVTWRHFWDHFEPEVQILQWFDSFEEVCEAENSIIRCTWSCKYSLNENCGGYISSEVCSRNGLDNIGKMNSHPRTKESREKNLKKMQNHPNTRRAMLENLVSNCKGNGEKNGNRSKKLGIGIHSQTKEEHSKFGKIGGQAVKERHRKPVLCLETGVVHPSIKEAGRETKVSPRSIRAVCKGERLSAGGYHWVFIGENT